MANIGMENPASAGFFYASVRLILIPRPANNKVMSGLTQLKMAYIQ
jgi:hypothetical protein